MDEHKAILNDVFGESSDDEDDQQFPLEDSSDGNRSELIFGANPIWERISEISGLCLCRDFLTSEQQSSLLSAIEKEGWFTEGCHNQAMRFGDLPAWATELSNSVREVVHFSDYVHAPIEIAARDKGKEACLFPSDLLWREPLFNQLILNIYQPGEGICAHVDLLRFEDGIAIVSLESSCVMHFSRVESEVCDIGKEVKSDPQSG